MSCQTNSPALFRAAARAISITPQTIQFLDGYPHVQRYSTGTDTELYSSALYLEKGSEKWLILGHDLLALDKNQVRLLRERIAAQTSVAPDHILVTCTHTHSAPISRVKYPVYTGDMEPVVDEEMLQWMTGRIVDNAVATTADPQPAEIGHSVADSSGVGGNRRDPNGPGHPCVPVLLVRNAQTGSAIAVMLVVSVHPTVLHEDSTLFSGDFPGHARAGLQDALGEIPVIYHNGASGNQSPRHVARENTVAEARRLGRLLAASVLEGIGGMTFDSAPDLVGMSQSVDLPMRQFPPVAEAEQREREVFERFDRMRREGADRGATRTAECDWFGAERLLKLARLQASGELEKRTREAVLPAEIQVLRIGARTFAAWPGEMFVEFAVELRAARPDVFAITYANGGTQGYLVTQEAVEEGGYEAAGATLKSPDSPQILVRTTLEMLRDFPPAESVSG